VDELYGSHDKSIAFFVLYVFFVFLSLFVFPKRVPYKCRVAGLGICLGLELFTGDRYLSFSVLGCGDLAGGYSVILFIFSQIE